MARCYALRLTRPRLPSLALHIWLADDVIAVAGATPDRPYHWPQSVKDLMLQAPELRQFCNWGLVQGESETAESSGHDTPPAPPPPPELLPVEDAHAAVPLPWTRMPGLCKRSPTTSCPFMMRLMKKKEMSRP